MGYINYSKLKEYRKKYLLLQAEVDKTENKLLSLPGRLGFKSIEELIDALRQVASAKKLPMASYPMGKTRRPRTPVTSKIIARVKELVVEGKTAKVIAHQVGVSEPTVNNIKKRLGLVTTRGS